MRTIKDKELHEKYCNICIDSPNSLFASLDESSKSIIRQTSICKMYRKGDLIYEEGNKPFGLICLITGKAKIAKKGIAGRVYRLPGFLCRGNAHRISGGS